MKLRIVLNAKCPFSFTLLLISKYKQEADAVHRTLQGKLMQLVHFQTACHIWSLFQRKEKHQRPLRFQLAAHKKNWGN